MWYHTIDDDNKNFKLNVKLYEKGCLSYSDLSYTYSEKDAPMNIQPVG